ncbi:MAG: Lrp/AsnC ligand binding domain-containing protein [Candidatus Woesearchaeota archaeon]
MEAYVLVSLDEPAEREILEEFQDLNEVKDSHILFGEWDLILQITGESPEAIADFVIEKVRSKSSVKLTSTLIVAQ